MIFSSFLVLAMGRARKPTGGGRAAKGKQGKAEASDDTDSPARLLEARRREAGKDGCEFGCGEGNPKNMQPGLEVTVCKECFGRYIKGFMVDGTIDNVVLKTATKDEVREEWEEAEEIEAGKRSPDWFPHDVAREDDVVVRVTRPMVGLTRADLCAILNPKTPEEVGIKLEDLKDEQNQAFKGILVPNPARPYVEYEFSRVRTVSNRETRMPSSSQIYTNQPDKTFEYEKKQFFDDKEVKTLVTKIRTMPWTVESVKEKLAQALNKEASRGGRPNASHPEAAGDAPSQLGGKMDCSGEVDRAASIKTLRGPVLNKMALEDSMSVASGGGERGAKAKNAKRPTVSPGTKLRAGSSQQDPYDSITGNELADRKIRALDISRVLNGFSLGRELRWAQDASEKLKADGEVRAHSLLQDHISKAKKAIELMDKGIAKLPEDAFASCVAVLDGFEFIPSNAKKEIWKRHLKSLKDSSSVNQFFDVVAPWQHEGDAGEFQMSKPRLCCMEGSTMDKTQAFEDAVGDRLCYLIDKGEQGKEEVLHFCKGALEYLDDKAPDVDDFDECMDVILACTKCMLCLADPRCVKNAGSVGLVENARKRRNTDEKATLAYGVGSAILNSAFYNAELGNFTIKLQGTCKHLPDVLHWEQQLSTQANADEAIASGSIAQLLQALPAWRSEVRPGAYEAVEEQAENCLKTYLDKSVNFDDETFKHNVPTALAFTKNLRAVLLAAKDSLRGFLTAWDTVLNYMQKFEGELKQSLTTDGFVEAARQVTARDLRDKAQREK